MKRLGVFILPPGWDASPSQGYPQHYAGTHLYTWVERGTVRVNLARQLDLIHLILIKILPLPSPFGSLIFIYLLFIVFLFLLEQILFT